MIKQAYFRGLTKVAGGYSWWNPSTWSARKNPVSGIVNPAVDAVYSKTPAGKAQKKLLQGGQLTADQQKAVRYAGHQANAIPHGAAAGALALPLSLSRHLWRGLQPLASKLTQQPAAAPKTTSALMRGYWEPYQEPAPAADPIPVTTPYGTATVRPTAAQVQAIQRAADTYDAAKGVLNGQRPVTVPLPGGASADVQLGPKAVQAIDAYKNKAVQALKGLGQRFRL